MVLTSEMVHDVHKTGGGGVGPIDDSFVYRPEFVPY